MEKDRLIQLEKKLRSADRSRVAKRADERNERVLSEIKEYHVALAQKCGISLAELHELLSDSESWFNFIKSKEEQADISPRVSVVSQTHPTKIPKSIKGRTMRFNTQKWDAMFYLHHQITSDGD